MARQRAEKDTQELWKTKLSLWLIVHEIVEIVPAPDNDNDETKLEMFLDTVGLIKR